MSKKLAAKNALIEMLSPAKPAAPTGPAAPALPRTRTAVGGMAQFVTTQSPIHREAEELRKVVGSFDGARVVRALAAASIIPSQWANRHDASFEAADFADLKREIQESGGNVQPIKVRPLNGSTPQAQDGGAQYEIVFGHRRHRACLELNIPVNALIEHVDDQKLFEEMERENRGRKNLSAWEQGCMYRAALEKGLYASQRKLSESIGVDVSLISKSIALAMLPESVIAAFPSPLDIQFRWAQPLKEVLQKNPERVIAKAKEIALMARSKTLNASEVFARLIKSQDDAPVAGHRIDLAIKEKRVGEWAVDSKGAVTFKLEAGAMVPQAQGQLLEMIQAFLKKI